jgi:hypothetical protein
MKAIFRHKRSGEVFAVAAAILGMKAPPDKRINPLIFSID